MKDHLKEQDIELLVLTPENLASERRKQMEDHLSICALCREIATFLRAFYSEFSSRPPEKDNRVEDFLSKLKNRERCIELVPFKFVPDPAEFGDRAMTVLAAKSETKNQYRYSTVCTLISKDENTLARILKDRESTDYRLFLVTRNFIPGLRATIRFPILGFSVSVQSDSPQTEFKLPANVPEVDWTTIVAELRFSQV